MLTLCTRICCAITLCLKNVPTLINKYFIANKCSPSSAPSARPNLFARRGACFDVDD